jgi:hypothetical protein
VGGIFIAVENICELGKQMYFKIWWPKCVQFWILRDNILQWMSEIEKLFDHIMAGVPSSLDIKNGIQVFQVEVFWMTVEDPQVLCGRSDWTNKLA